MTKRPYLSIIIPNFNGEETLPTLFDSIFNGYTSNFEVILVDDASKDNSLGVAKPYPVRTVRLSRNRGPAFARNSGVKAAKGEVVLFLDNDVVVKKGTLKRVADFFRDNPNKNAVTGSWSRKQEDGFFPRYKALRDWSYWSHELYQKGAGYFFSTRIAAVRKKLFWQAGGFSEYYRKPDVEDMEFSYRLSKITPVHFDSKIQVLHKFEPIFPVAKKYFRRAFYWSKLFCERKRFDKAAATPNEAALTALATFFIFSLPFSIAFPGFISLSLVLLGFYLLLYRKFLSLAYEEEGFFFTLKSVFVGFILYPFVFAGAALGMLAWIEDRIKDEKRG